MEPSDNKLKIFVKNYWSYYLRLEAKFLATLNYVEFDSINFNTFSLEYLNLLLSVCSEIDVVGKMMAHEQNSDFKEDGKNNNIYKWWTEIKDNFEVSDKKLIEQTANFLDKELSPWKAISESTVPSWWTSYNEIKHNRTKKIDETGNANYIKANLENVANAFAGLYILEHSFIKSVANEKSLKLIPKSKMFEKEEKYLDYYNPENENLKFSPTEMFI